MSSSEELADQEGSAEGSTFEQGEGAPTRALGGQGLGLGVWAWPPPASARLTPCPPPADLNGMAPDLSVAIPSGPFRHVGLSKAARTHRLRKLRTPAKCRECNSYVYFQGAECEEVRGGDPRAQGEPGRSHAERSAGGMLSEVQTGAFGDLEPTGGRGSPVEGTAHAKAWRQEPAGCGRKTKDQGWIGGRQRGRASVGPEGLQQALSGNLDGSCRGRL